MNAVELRTLDGPNLFMLRPAIKLELVAEPGETVTLTKELTDRLTSVRRSATGPAELSHLVGELIAGIGIQADLPVDEIVYREVEEPGHVVVAYSWQRRNAARAVGELAWRIVSGEDVDLDAEVAGICALLDEPAYDDDRPDMITDEDRRIPTIGVTGTNGKTTTTRLIAWILRSAGNSVAWTSSAGVVVDGEMVLPGDYTGPAGANRVFEETGIDYAVLETARGGILLRGLGYQSSDVSVVTNISADHMGLHGVYTLEELTAVKAVVARATKPGGRVVLNADDPRVLGMREAIRAQPFLFSRHPDQDAIREQVAAGGWALFARDGAMVWCHDGEETVVATLDAVPLTFGGRAQHMVENALAAAGACIAIGLSVEQVRDGLASFRNRADQNRGRLNVYRLGEAVVVIDFAHNEAGLSHLLTFARSFCEGDGRVISVVGTAGDRDDAALSGIARIAGDRSDRVIIKDTTKYLRGRQAGEMPDIMRPLVGNALVGDADSEWEGFQKGLDLIEAGDTLAVMCIEESDRILAWLDEHGTALS